MFNMPRELLRRFSVIFIDNEFGHLVLQHGERIYFVVCDLRFLESSFNVNRPSERVRKKMENYAEICGNFMWKKVTILRKRRQIMRIFLKLIKSFPWLSQTYKIHVNVLPKI